MGRRGRARARQGGAAAPAAKAPRRGRIDLGPRGSRRRAWVAAAAFGVIAAFCGVVWLVSDYPPWRPTTVLFAVLAAVWAGKAALTRDE